MRTVVTNYKNYLLRHRIEIKDFLCYPIHIFIISFIQFLTLPLMFMIFDKLSRILEKEILQIFWEIKRHKLNWSARNCWSYKSQKNFLLSFLSIFSSFLSFNATLRMNEKSIVITRAGQNGGFKKMSLTNKKNCSFLES